MKKIRLEILEYSYWEHFKSLKDISFVLPLEHPKRVLLEKIVNELIVEINQLKKELEDNDGR